ncbi:MAG: septation protein [Sphingomonas bacterium]|uniref:inner membrane-spanning protein YciB n=1 Tax=Sphingomonas bacterium TaxID=1895847 RepID=UPI0026029B13|nr:inner membrane-spanning protein YciB [Sphingomonas bacterium]MDB5708109.1 septation protein [Sphingomonas bacterium]
MASNPDFNRPPPFNRPKVGPGVRMAIDYAPLLIFFGVNFLAPGPQIERVLAATASFMVASAITMIVSRWKTGHISPMLWLSGTLVLVFGSLTLWFHNPNFIKMKPTFVYAIFAIVLGFGLITHRPLLKQLLETSYPGLDEKGWHKLTINWMLFFVAMAIANEAVWRITAPDMNSDLRIWTLYKFPGCVIITLVFAMANIPMLMKHGLTVDAPVEVPPEG